MRVLLRLVEMRLEQWLRPDRVRGLAVSAEAYPRK